MFLYGIKKVRLSLSIYKGSTYAYIRRIRDAPMVPEVGGTTHLRMVLIGTKCFTKIKVGVTHKGGTSVLTIPCLVLFSSSYPVLFRNKFYKLGNGRNCTVFFLQKITSGPFSNFINSEVTYIQTGATLGLPGCFYSNQDIHPSFKAFYVD